MPHWARWAGWPTTLREDELRSIARLRAAGLLLDQKKFDEAGKQLDAAQQGKPREFDALIADRRGDILAAQGKRAEAVAAYQAAYKAMDAKTEYRTPGRSQVDGARRCAGARDVACERGGQMSRLRSGAALVGLCAALAACSSDKPKPTPLESITPAIAGRSVWDARVDAPPFVLMPAVAKEDGCFHRRRR